ncbi:type II secretion system F family protein [Oceanisphaera sp.]|uniref:type II secretion system F family protein n=1 Tax=Oceanisphaera sp. TaxID=1929979 RepID=UPI003A9165D0
MPLNMKKPTPTPTARATPFAGLFQKRLKPSDRLFFSEQLSLLLETGTSILPALKTIRLQTRHPAMHVLLSDLEQRIADGQPLSQALSHHPRLFNSTYVNLVAAAEGGGFLNKVLQHLAELDERREQLRQQLKSAASYPMFLALFSVAVMLFVLVVVFPKFADMFVAIRDQLPWTTTVLMNTSDIMRQHWPWLCLATALLAVGGYIWAGSAAGRQRLDSWRMTLPGIRGFYIRLYLTESLRVLGLSLSHGVPLVTALDATREVIGNRQFQQFIGQLQQNVIEGKGLSYGFEQAGWTPSLVRQMLRTGEDTGNLPKVMLRLTEHYEREVRKHLNTLTKLAEPLMLLVMGLVVGVLVSSLILPIFKLSRVAY